MAGSFVDVTIEDQQLSAALRKMADHGRDLKPALNLIGQIMVRSVRENFLAEGRPEKWKKRKKNVEKHRILEGSGMRGGLMGSITYQIAGGSVRIGTNKVYAATHQFGQKDERIILPKRKQALFWPGLEHPVKRSVIKANTIPARPFLMIQDQDRRTISSELGRMMMP